MNKLIKFTVAFSFVLTSSVVFAQSKPGENNSTQTNCAQVASGTIPAKTGQTPTQNSTGNNNAGSARGTSPNK